MTLNVIVSIFQKCDVTHQIDKNQRKSNILLVFISKWRCLRRSPQEERWCWAGQTTLKKKSNIWVCSIFPWAWKVTFGFAQLQHIPMKSELTVHLFFWDPSAENLSSTLLEQQPPLAFWFQQQPLSRYPWPFLEPGRGWFVVHDHLICVSQTSLSFQPVEEPPWLQSQPRHV